MVRTSLLALCLLMASFGVGSPALGQVPGLSPTADPESAAEDEIESVERDAQVQAFLALLRTQAVQSWLLEEGEEASNVPDPELGRVTTGQGLGEWVDGVRERFARFETAITALPEELRTAHLILTLQLGAGGLTQPIMAAVALLFLGLAVEVAGRLWLLRVLRGVTRNDEASGEVEILAASKPLQAQLLQRVTIRLAGLMIFSAVGLGGFFLIGWTPVIELLVFSFLLAIIATRLVASVADLVLAPWERSARLLPLGDGTARSLSLWTILLTAVSMVGWLGVRALSDLGLVTEGGFALGHLVLAILIVLTMVAVLVQGSNLRSLCRLVIGSGRSAIDRVVVLLALVWLLVVWALALIGAHPVLALWLGISAFFALDQLLLPLLMLLARRGQDGGEISPFLPIWRRVARLLITLAIALPVLNTWGINLCALAESRMGGSALAAALFDVALTLLLADLVWQTARIAIARRLAKGEAAASDLAEAGGEGGGVAGPDARARTLLPLFGKVLGGVLVVLTSMIVLSALGVDIGPLLAGAGVVGIAVGFGAQALVRDIVSGVFFLIDDAFRVGEYIESGELRGTVEAISLRSMKLRHHRGHIHTVPFGELRSLTNYSRDWVIMKLEFRVPFDTDLGLVKRLVKQVGKDLMADPIMGSGFLEPVKSQGVRRMEEFNMVVGVKFMTKPGAQWLIRREIYQRILAIFEENGISLAQRDVNVNVRRDATEAEVNQAVTGAAQALVAQTQPEPSSTPGG